jgi:hypothetical protein
MVLFGACKKEVTITPNQDFTLKVKVIDYDTKKPMGNHPFYFIGDNDITKKREFDTTLTTNQLGEISLTIKRKPDVWYYIGEKKGGFVRIVMDKYIWWAADPRGIENRITHEITYEHTYELLRGSDIPFYQDLDKIHNKDTLEYVFHQVKNGKNLFLASSVEPITYNERWGNSFFHAPYINDLEIYVKYRYKSKNIWKFDTLQGNIKEYQMKY